VQPQETNATWLRDRFDLSALGKQEASIGVTDDGFVGLYFRDLNRELRLAVTMTPSGKPMISVNDGNTSRIQMGVVDAPGGTGEEFSVVIRDAAGKVLWRPPIVNLVSSK
jgi:hypothetical protein